METKNKEIRLFGTAGAGKTTELKRMIQNAAQKFGSENIIVSSFSKTAARELVGRNLPVSEEKVATLHAHCYRALGKPEIAETKEWINEWNDYVQGKAEDFRLTGGDASFDDAFTDFVKRTDGDNLLSEYNLLRAKMLDSNPKTSEFMNLDLKHFAKMWEDFKESCQIFDFTDLISLALRDIKTAPNAPKVGFFDEVQDFSLLELSLARSWSEKMEYSVFAGDDEQCIFEFKGASPEAFLVPEIPETMKRILGRSWRVPRRVQEKALKLVRQVRFRQEKNYAPRYEVEYEDGRRIYDETRIAEGFFKYAKYGMQGIEANYLVEEMINDFLSEGKTMMFLASCSYQLTALVKALRTKGLAFHNPYRKQNGAWNPLGQKKTSKKVEQFLYASMSDSNGLLWNTEEFTNWTELTKISGFLKKGALRRIEESGKSAIALEDLKEHFTKEEDIKQAIAGDLGFLRKYAKPAYESRINYLCTMVEKFGLSALNERPQIMVGTIHSVKGGEADTVVVCPDLSPQGFECYNSYEGRDGVIRQFYVAMTRSFENLVVAQPSGNSFIYL